MVLALGGSTSIGDCTCDTNFYDKGSTIKLKCMVENIVGEQPEYIIWKKGDRMLNYDTERGGIRWVGTGDPK